MRFAFLILALVQAASALLAVQPRRAIAQRSGSPAMGLFGGLADAFKNDDSLGARENAGLSKEKAKKTITWQGPNGQSKKSLVVPGQNLGDIARVSPPSIRSAWPHTLATPQHPTFSGYGHKDQIRLQ